MSEVLQWSGAIVVLIAFGLSQYGAWSVVSYRYLLFNFVGGAGLSAAAALSHQWGFAVLEGVWAAVAGWGISARLRGREPRTPSA
jgi:hypothetical protein